MLRLARQIAAWLLIPLLVVSVVCGVAGRALAASVELFDANIRYTSGIFLPLSSYRASTIQPLTTATWTSAAHAISRVAADGASLILVRVTLLGGRSGAVRVSLSSGEPDTDPGSLWAVDDRHVVDASRLGGDIDDPREPRRKLPVRSVGGGGQRFAFLLYRAPRNFDSASGSTSPLASRQAWLTVEFPRSSSMVSITIVRPLIVFIHGTGDDNDAWAQFPLWQNSANELGDFQAGTLPFQATRISFYWIWNSTGGVQENAETILPQLVTALRDWREATLTAATQADVVTHSFGGFIARQVAQTQPDADPLTLDSLHNFRAAANWGHGVIHKLITLAATHRGSAAANTAAYLNVNNATDNPLGITLTSEKVLLGFVQTGTENERVCAAFLRALLERGLRAESGLLCVIDGAKGLRKALEAVFGSQALVQRCQWHKRENVVGYLPTAQQAAWRRKLQAAYEQPRYPEAKAALHRLRQELRLLNASAVTSLDEGLEETLTLHRLGLFEALGRSLKTTNCLESIMAQVGQWTDKIDRWRTSDQKQRWVATALLDIEPRLRRIKGYRHLPLLRAALQRETTTRAGNQEQVA